MYISMYKCRCLFIYRCGIHLCMQIYVDIFIYIYMYMYMCMCVYIYVYVEVLGCSVMRDVAVIRYGSGDLALGLGVD